MAGRSVDFSGRGGKATRSGFFDRAADWLSDPAAVTWIGIAVVWAALLGGALPVVLAHAAPSGADPGNWLDLAWSLTGQGSRLSEWAYPPFSFVILRGLLVFLKPLVALKVLGLISWGALATALWITLNRSLPLLPAPIKIGMAALFSFPGYGAEMFAWGGYPQLLGMAFLTLALPALEEALHTGKRKASILAVGASLAVIFTHHLLAAVLPILWALVFLWTVGFNRGSRRAIWGRFWKLGAVAAVLSLSALPIYLKYISLLSGNPANPGGFSAENIPFLVQYLYRGLAPLWLTLLALAIAAPWITPRTRLSASTFALTTGTLVLFSILWEVRVLHILFTGMAFGVGILVEDAWSRPAHPRLARARGALLAACLGLALLAGLYQGRQELGQAADYYRVVDDDMLPGMDWVIAHVPTGDRIAASQTRPDLLGWWIEGYSRRATLAASDPRWLSFSAERQNTDIANQIFSANIPPERVAQLLHQNDVGWLFVDKQDETFDLSPLVGSGVLTAAYEDGRVLILKVNRSGT